MGVQNHKNKSTAIPSKIHNQLFRLFSDRSGVGGLSKVRSP